MGEVRNKYFPKPDFVKKVVFKKENNIAPSKQIEYGEEIWLGSS